VFLGIMEEAVYQTAGTSLTPGETLVAYTDGVTEAMNPAQQLFGSTRLLALLAAQAGRNPEALDEAVMQAVRDFAGEAPQADDITVLSLLFRGSEPG